jgi:formylglycine-generating enzyme required for sulfatase activity
MNDLISAYRAAAREIPAGPGITMVALGATPVTNEIALAILNAPSLDNGDRQGAYHYVNVHNPELPLQWNADRGYHLVSDEFLRHPVVGVSWRGAQAFAAVLGGRLPTVTEWEYAATCRERVRFPWGDGEPTPDLANYDEHYGATTPAGNFPANAWGLLDMAGNVGEWCAMRPADTAAGFAPATDYVVKGGSWNKGAAQLECAVSRLKWGRVGTAGIGFRVAFD